MAEDNNGKNWWTTLPGIITSTATLVTAIGGLIAILNSNGYFNKTEDKKQPDSADVKETGTVSKPETAVITPVAVNHAEPSVKNETTDVAENNIRPYILKGNVGRLPAVFRLTFNNSNKQISGTYYYPKRPGITYKITGTINEHSITLNEYTAGSLSATCTLETTDNQCYSGMMNNKNGRVIDMNICKINL